MSAFAVQPKSWSSTTTGAQAGAAAAHLRAALQATTPRLQAIAKGYAPAAPALGVAVDAARALERDLGDLARLNQGLTVLAWSEQYRADLAKSISAADAARTTLGLPPIVP